MAEAPTPAVLVRTAKDGTPFFEAKWRAAGGRQIKRRLGRAWISPDGAGGWTRRRGRPRDGWLDERTAHAAAAEMVAAVYREHQAAVEAAARAGIPTFRRVAHEWLEWKRDVKGGAPSTLANDALLLREPGEPYKRGRGTVKGRVMARFGDRPHDEITPREVAQFLRDLDSEGLSARNVNEHRSLLHAVFTYAMKPDTYALASNPAAGTDKRYQPPPPPLDHYEVEEVEALARACERGEHRSAMPNYRGRPALLSDDEQQARRLENHQDGDLFRVKFYSGMRLGEVIALRWRHIHFLPDLSGAVLDVERAVSAGVEKLPKGRRGRQVPLPRPGAEALARLGQRGDFTDPDDYVFCNRFGDRLDPSAIRRRYKRATAAAGLRPIKLHGLRHAAGSVLARTLPLVTVRDVLGHAELRTTNRYLHSKIDPAAIVAVNAAFGAESGPFSGKEVRREGIVDP
ncbi:tyrosine-type recombinase/integrase [Conexibacter sp. JD483]|uniref:tyrosine-type recombinase/integrase n=1 Tax=unclassified Conexibacter TaxID=2627773 RepID=UPI002728FA5A|nr:MULTISPECIES: tyrosine-type recombinase/integrase [unclassified Conexibacter]MDO8186467.1 tyrosine-type recombinase/integrase [Conexibacter sp. CPCC 205706]MDO8200036.1 tyrosine-type recombinase/integrase [Conexibacter sp. CPCC 205762]MDR9370888.1 tyrosine-type recombinase/integrase [Conexibacter sp. JD483]